MLHSFTPLFFFPGRGIGVPFLLAGDGFVFTIGRNISFFFMEGKRVFLQKGKEVPFFHHGARWIFFKWGEVSFLKEEMNFSGEAEQVSFFTWSEEGSFF